jgi:hypothetical protein
MVQCETIETATDWALKNIFDFVGLDFVIEPFFNTGDFYLIFQSWLYVIDVCWISLHRPLPREAYRKYDNFE